MLMCFIKYSLVINLVYSKKIVLLLLYTYSSSIPNHDHEWVVPLQLGGRHRVQFSRRQESVVLVPDLAVVGPRRRRRAKDRSFIFVSFLDETF
jgi:hypothetical protein